VLGRVICDAIICLFLGFGTPPITFASVRDRFRFDTLGECGRAEREVGEDGVGELEARPFRFTLTPHVGPPAIGVILDGGDIDGAGERWFFATGLGCHHFGVISGPWPGLSMFVGYAEMQSRDRGLETEDDDLKLGEMFIHSPTKLSGSFPKESGSIS
jgi:hypothetical protein